MLDLKLKLAEEGRHPGYHANAANNPRANIQIIARKPVLGPMQ